jgi:hypothetical protein
MGFKKENSAGGWQAEGDKGVELFNYIVFNKSGNLSVNEVYTCITSSLS